MSDEKHFPDPTAADLETAKAKSRKVFTFETAGHTVLCKPISKPTWQRIQRILKDTESTDDVTDVILLDVLAYPAREKMELLLEDFPGAFEAVALDLINRAKGQEMKRGKAA